MKKGSGILFKSWRELKSLQDKKLHNFITHQLYPFSAYYRRLFNKHKIDPGSIRTVEDLQRIPFTSKADFNDPKAKDPVKRSRDFILQPKKELIRKYLPKSELLKFSVLNLTKGKEYLKERLEKEYRPIFLTATAGTTTMPTSFLYTNYDIDNLKVFGKRMIDIFGIKRGEKAVNVFPYAPHLAFWQTVFAGFSGNIFILSTGGGKAMGTEGNVRTIIKVKPQLLIGVPSYVYHLLKVAREQKTDFRYLKTIVLGAACVPKGFKKKISDIVAKMGARNINVMGTYGFTESRCAWSECPTGIEISSGYHTYPDKEVFEIIDPETGEVKGEGEDGELVYSGIDARGSCVLRFRTGDMVKGGIVYSPCPHCGRTVPRISSDICRASNVKDLQLSKIKGSLVNLNVLERLLDDRKEINEWQIEIGRKNNDRFEVEEMVLYVNLFKNVNKKSFLPKLNQMVFSSADVSFNRVKFVSIPEIQQRMEVESALKPKKIIDRRDEC